MDFFWELPYRNNIRKSYFLHLLEMVWEVGTWFPSSVFAYTSIIYYFFQPRLFRPKFATKKSCSFFFDRYRVIAIERRIQLFFDSPCKYFVGAVISCSKWTPVLKFLHLDALKKNGHLWRCVLVNSTSYQSFRCRKFRREHFSVKVFLKKKKKKNERKIKEI